jgi:hypothetical protein
LDLLFQTHEPKNTGLVGPVNLNTIMNATIKMVERILETSRQSYGQLALQHIGDRMNYTPSVNEPSSTASSRLPSIVDSNPHGIWELASALSD